MASDKLGSLPFGLKKQVTVPPLIISNVLGISGAHPLQPPQRLDGSSPRLHPVASRHVHTTLRLGGAGPTLRVPAHWCLVTSGDCGASPRISPDLNGLDGCELCVSR